MVGPFIFQINLLGFVCILNEISLKFVARDPIDNKSNLTQVMVHCQTSDKPFNASVFAKNRDALF